jgi:hypothetical protein
VPMGFGDRAAWLTMNLLQRSQGLRKGKFQETHRTQHITYELPQLTSGREKKVPRKMPISQIDTKFAKIPIFRTAEPA